ncbi:MAG: hypothetical protein EXX96DRAFT_536244 [Benjaminiella poitrasii]|nr:MAG: hypothetical protein EXX96DRAFT_536244 [Benjaminiella poitrasii]
MQLYVNMKILVRLKSLRCGVTGIFYQASKKRERVGDLVVVTIDEYLTSQKVSHVVGSSILACTACHTLWQRDVNAAINTMTIAKSVWGTTSNILKTAYNAIIAVANTVCPSRLKIFTENKNISVYYV